MNVHEENGSKSKGFISIPLISYSVKHLNNPILKVISEELGSPISVIQSSINLLKAKGVHPDKSIYNEVFGLCEDSVESILGFIENMNFLFDSNLQKTEIKPKKFLIKSLVEHAIEEVNFLNLDISRIQVHYTLECTTVIFDKYKLYRLLVNLLDNALKFSRKEVNLYVNLTKNKLEIVVHDFGIGIPESQFPEIFKPFVRCNNANMISGSGLGLSIVAKVLEYYNGTIAIKSIEDKGTEIEVIIPVTNCGEPEFKLFHKKSLRLENN